MSSRQKKHRHRHLNTSSGFTLVEMLVAVALVMLMMTMFATIFQMATGSADKQRIIAESDQRSRQLTTILRADFAKRSFRNSFPFLPNEDPNLSKVPFAARTGYLYISCNDPTSFQDDIVQFTVDARQVQTNPDDSRYYGAAALLFDSVYGVANSTNPSLPYSPNQPEADDGDLEKNGTASSDAAEISLFLRGGSLIRRIMLIRDPLPVVGADLETQPTSTFSTPPNPPNRFFLTDGGAGTGGFFFLGTNPGFVQTDFWSYFDFSAVPSNMSNVPNGVSFVGMDALKNDGTPSANSFGIPNFRFGFNPVTGLSREHNVSPLAGFGPNSFLGRFLQAETSSVNFNWPQGLSSDERADLNDSAINKGDAVLSVDMDLNGSVETATNGNPFDIVGTPLSLNTGNRMVSAFDGVSQSVVNPSTGVPVEGRGGTRRVEDVLMSNVREFRIELWDSRLERWVVPGHSASRRYLEGGVTARDVLGDYHLTRNSQFDSVSTDFTYGPLQVGPGTPDPHVFDTWHPAIRRDVDVDMINDLSEVQAPFYPLRYYPPRQNDVPVGPSSPAMPNPALEYDPVADRLGANRGYWTPNTDYLLNDVVFADTDLTAGWDNDGDGLFEWDADAAITPPGLPAQSVHVAYRCVGTTNASNSTATPAGTSGTSVPPWQSPGLTFLDGDLLWEGFQNYQPLKSIRLTISFIEPNSETPKQLSLVLPMTDEAR